MKNSVFKSKYTVEHIHITFLADYLLVKIKDLNLQQKELADAQKSKVTGSVRSLRGAES